MMKKKKEEEEKTTTTTTTMMKMMMNFGGGGCNRCDGPQTKWHGWGNRRGNPKIVAATRD